MRYNDPQHIKDYEESGKFPKIHDHIYSAVKRATIADKPVLDLGASIGLLSARMIDGKVTNKVFAFEPNKNSLAIAVKKPEITYFSMGVTDSNIQKLYGFMSQHEIKTILARRVFPEIAERFGIKTVQAFARAASAAGVEKIVLEGRKQSTLSTAILKSADKEAACFAPFYEVVESFKDVRVLKNVNQASKGE